MTQIIRIPRNHDGERCGICWNSMRNYNQTYQEAKAEHSHCHDWTHCGHGCCGPCPHCGEGGYLEDY